MPTEVFIDASDPSRQGAYRRANGSLTAASFDFVRNDQCPRRFHIMEESVASALEKLRHRDVTGTTLKVAIGQPDLGPSGGTFALTFAGSGTGMTVLAYDITAAALETAMNSNAAVSSAGGVDVTGGPYQFVIKFRTFADKAEFIGDETNLEPASRVSIQTTEPGTGSVHEEQVIRLLRLPYAYSDNWTPETADGTATVALSPTGSATTKGVVNLTLPEAAESGSFRLEFSRVQAWQISVTSYFPAVQQSFFLSLVAPSVSSGYGGLFWDVEDKNGPVRMWMDCNNASVAPAVPAGGRLLELNYPNTTNAATIIAAIKVDLNADAEFAGTISASTTQLLVVQTAGGTRVAPPPTVVGTFDAVVTMSVSQAGTNGELGGKFLTIADNAGAVAVWFDVHQDIEPAHLADRSIRVAAAGMTSAALLRTAIKDAIDADAQFTATESGVLVLVTDLAAGTRDIGDPNLPARNTSRLPVGVVTPGAGVAGEFPFDVTATDLAIAFTDFFEVTPTKPGQFRFVAKANGTWSAPSIASNFVVPTYFDGTINLATTTLLAAFAATTEDTLDATLEVEHTTAGAVDTILRMPVLIYRDVIDAATIAPTPLPDYYTKAEVDGLFAGINGPFESDSDSAAVPGFSFGGIVGREDDGFFSNGAGQVGLALGGANTFDFSTTLLQAAAGIKSSHATTGLGYTTGAGGTVTQLTNKATGVTLNKATGEITMNGAALAGATLVSFVLTNSAIAAADLVLVEHVATGTIGVYKCSAAAAAGSATIRVLNLTAGSLSEAIVLKFVVFKAVTT